MPHIRSRNTKPELDLRSALFKTGFRLRVRTGLKEGPGVVFTRTRLAVSVDGCLMLLAKLPGALDEAEV